MNRSTNSTGRPKHLEQNLNRLVVDTSNNKPTSTSQTQTAQPTIRNIVEKNGKIIYPSIQLQEYKSFITRHDDDSSIVESSASSTNEDSSTVVELSSTSDEEVRCVTIFRSCEPYLSSRPSIIQKKNSVVAYEQPTIHSFEQMPEEVIRKILFENIIDFSDVPKTAKNLMKFASISQFNREFVRVLLAEERMRAVSFEITKSAIPDLLSKLAIYKKMKFSRADIDDLVHNWPYLTFDCSYDQRTTFTERGLQALKKILRHPGLREVRIINNLPDNNNWWNKNFLGRNNNGPELIYSLLSRKNSDPMKIDFQFKHWLPPLNSKFQLEDKSFNLLKKIQEKADSCKSVSFGELDLSREYRTCISLFNHKNHSWLLNREYQLKFVKMMCNITLMHSVHTISLSGLKLLDEELSLIINEIQQCDKPSLRNLDLSGNQINQSAAKSLSILLQSENTCLKTLNLQKSNLDLDALLFISNALENNRSLELIEIDNNSLLRYFEKIENDKRVKIINYDW